MARTVSFTGVILIIIIIIINSLIGSSSSSAVSCDQFSTSSLSDPSIAFDSVLTCFRQLPLLSGSTGESYMQKLPKLDAFIASTATATATSSNSNGAPVDVAAFLSGISDIINDGSLNNELDFLSKLIRLFDTTFPRITSLSVAPPPCYEQFAFTLPIYLASASASASEGAQTKTEEFIFLPSPLVRFTVANRTAMVDVQDEMSKYYGMKVVAIGGTPIDEYLRREAEIARPFEFANNAEETIHDMLLPLSGEGFFLRSVFYPPTNESLQFTLQSSNSSSSSDVEGNTINVTVNWKIAFSDLAAKFFSVSQAFSDLCTTTDQPDQNENNFRAPPLGVASSHVYSKFSVFYAQDNYVSNKGSKKLSESTSSSPYGLIRLYNLDDWEDSDLETLLSNQTKVMIDIRGNMQGNLLHFIRFVNQFQQLFQFDTSISSSLSQALQVNYTYNACFDWIDQYCGGNKTCSYPFASDPLYAASLLVSRDLVGLDSLLAGMSSSPKFSHKIDEAVLLIDDRCAGFCLALRHLFLNQGAPHIKVIQMGALSPDPSTFIPITLNSIDLDNTIAIAHLKSTRIPRTCPASPPTFHAGSMFLFGIGSLILPTTTTTTTAKPLHDITAVPYVSETASFQSCAVMYDHSCYHSYDQIALDILKWTTETKQPDEEHNLPGVGINIVFLVCGGILLLCGCYVFFHRRWKHKEMMNIDEPLVLNIPVSDEPGLRQTVPDVHRESVLPPAQELERKD